MYSTIQFFTIITIIGVATLAIRAVFLYYVPRFIERPMVRRGMDAVPAAMLVALVVPFTLFYNQMIDIFRPEVLAIVITIPVVLLTKRYAYGLIIAIICFILLGQVMN